MVVLGGKEWKLHQPAVSTTVSASVSIAVSTAVRTAVSVVSVLIVRNRRQSSSGGEAEEVS